MPYLHLKSKFVMYAYYTCMKIYKCIYVYICIYVYMYLHIIIDTYIYLGGYTKTANRHIPLIGGEPKNPGKKLIHIWYEGASSVQN